jgi:hypothetical protein
MNPETDKHFRVITTDSVDEHTAATYTISEAGVLTFITAAGEIVADYTERDWLSVQLLSVHRDPPTTDVPTGTGGRAVTETHYLYRSRETGGKSTA